MLSNASGEGGKGEASQWYSLDEGGKTVGPFPMSTLLSRLRGSTDALVWRAGMAAWTRAGEVTELSVSAKDKSGGEMGGYSYEHMTFDPTTMEVPFGANNIAGSTSSDSQNQSQRNRSKKRKATDLKRAAEAAPTTSVYVTGLPSDATLEEVASVFQKCGIIREDPETHQPKVRLYRDEATDMLKGDGLVTYLKAPSVALAIQILDETPLRDGLSQPMRVQEAKFDAKEKKVAKKIHGVSKKERRATSFRQERQLNWEGFDDEYEKKEITVILKHMFTPDEVVGDTKFQQELEEDLLSECSNFGKVKRVKIITTSKDGVVSIEFKEPAAAQSCVAKMEGRFFAGRQLRACMWDGFTKYHGNERETEEEELARLEKYAADIEKD